MKNITDIFNLAYDRMLQGNYPYLYIAVDVHDTVLMRSKTRCLCNGSIIEMDLPTNDIFFYKAKDVLQKLSKCDRMKLILFTSSTDKDIRHYLDLFKMHGINFHFVNSNPEVVSDVSYADFSHKFYFDILLDDKAGFDPRHDWNELWNWTWTRLPRIVDQNNSIHDGH